MVGLRTKKHVKAGITEPLWTTPIETMVLPLTRHEALVHVLPLEGEAWDLGTGMSNRDFLSLGGGCQGGAGSQRHSWPSSLSSAPSPPAPLSRLCPYGHRPSQGLPPPLFPAFPGAPGLAPELAPS